MAIYTVGRRRVIIGLLLTSALLLTLDIRGNAVLDRVRDVFSTVMSPVDSATDVVAKPIARGWRGITDYDDLERENQRLQDRIDRLEGLEASALFSVQQLQALRSLLDLPSLAGIPTEVAEVVGRSANNLDQTIEINKGRTAGFRVGMPVVNQAGLIGKITFVTLNTATVQLITDSRYSVAVQIQAGVGDDSAAVPVVTSPSGRTDDELRDLVTTTSAPSTTLAADVIATETTLPQNDGLPAADVVDPLVPVDGVLVDGAPVDPNAPVDDVATDPTAVATTTTTTTTVPDGQPKEFGGLEGRGGGELPIVRFLQDVPSLAVLSVGDLVFTAGGFESLAPPDIPVGVVVNRANRSGTSGPLLQIEPTADLGNLSFVNVVLYTPLSEVEQ